MAGVTLEKGKAIYTYGQPLTALHLILGGRVQVNYPGGSYTLSKGDIIGVCEICSEIHFLSYSALEETNILTYPLISMEGLGEFLQKHLDVARLFLLSAFHQMNVLMNKCSLSELSCTDMYQSLTEDYEAYTALCNRYRLSPRELSDRENLAAYLGDEAPDLWLSSMYLGMQHLYAGENFRPLVAEAGVSLGLLRKCSLDFRKTYLGLEEQFRYRQQLSRYFFNESGNDIFDFYTSLYYKLGTDCADSEQIFSTINRIILQFENNSSDNAALTAQRIQGFRDHLSLITRPDTKEELSDADTAVLSELAGSLNTILEFAGSDLALCSNFRQHIHSYKALADKSATDDETCTLRKDLAEEFYALYAILFQRSMEEPAVPMPVRMFLEFGYADEGLAGRENALLLYKLSKEHIDRSEFGIYTFYEWLLAIFQGKKQPSRNEFDSDYSDYIHKLKLSGSISDAEFRTLESNPMSRVNYELRNMFPHVNKITFGRLATFCPIFSADNVLKNLEDSYVTMTQIGKAFELIKKIDYSAFYRESYDYEHMNVMGKETIHLEFMPDIILMPNVGIRGVMWQEIEGKVRNSNSRMIFSIFHMEDINTSIIRLTGEFRWELCKRIQGPRWNDVSERSLTSEYFDYIQFYRKNHDLSNEAKEKVRASLQRAKNSFKEMFVRDYTLWILFEGNSSPRLNKAARKILFTYCPFPSDVLRTISQNPLFSELLAKNQVLTAQRVHHLNMFIKKLQNSGASVPETLLKELDFAQGEASK